MHCDRVRRARPLLGTRVEISLAGRSETELHAAATAAFAEIARVHELMSLHSASSDLFRLNNAPVASVVQVDARTWRVLELAAEIAEASGGVFDISVGGEMMVRGELPKMVQCLPQRRASYRDIELLPDNCVRLRRALAVDVGGIAKGYAVDRAVDVLRELAAPAGCVNAGGDLRAFGTEPVTVQVRDPNTPLLARAHVDLRDCALATSANYAPVHGFNSAGIVLDPRTDEPLVAGRSASVRAGSCAVADALAKCVLVLGVRSAPLLSRYQADGFILDGDTSILIGEDSSQRAVSAAAGAADTRPADARDSGSGAATKPSCLKPDLPSGAAV